MSDTLDLLKSFAKSSQPAAAPAIAPVELVGNKAVTYREWDELQGPRYAAKFRKPPNEWGQKDMLMYVGSLYYESFGKQLKWAWGTGYGLLRDVENMLRHALRVTEVTKGTEKDYYDYAFKYFVPKAVAEGKQFKIYWFKDETWVARFAQARRQGLLPSAVVAPVVVDAKPLAQSDELTLERLDKAFSIGRAYFVINYGPIVAANYLMLRKRKTEIEAQAYLQDAARKFSTVSDDPKGELMAALKKYGPYPKWFPLLNVECVGVAKSEIELCDDSALLGCLKPAKES